MEKKMNIQLKYINKSNDKNNSDVVIFQKATNPDYNMETIAWKVIRNCGTGDYHPFEYDYNLKINAADSYGNFTPSFNADPDDLLHMMKDDTGDVLKLIKGGSTNPDEIQVVNKLTKGSINACCYRSGKLLAKKVNVVPDEEAIFAFHPKIYVGVISDIAEGEVMSSAIVNEINTEISLSGLKSAVIAMRGGGSGANSSAYTFSLEDKAYM